MPAAIPITHEQIEMARTNRARGVPVGETARALGLSRQGLNAALLRSDRKVLAKWEPKRRRDLVRQVERLEDTYREARAQGELMAALKALADIRDLLRLDELDMTPKGEAGAEARRTVIILPDNGRGRADGDGTADHEDEDA